MKVLLYSDHENLIEKSGIGKALEHQRLALDASGVNYSLNPRDNFDLIQINTVFPSSFIKSLISRLRGKKIIYYAHSTMEDFKNSFKGSNFLAPFFKFWICLCYNSGDLIITPTDYSKSVLYSYKRIKKPIISLSNGIDTSFYSYKEEYGQRFRDKYRIPKDKKVVLSVGHYIERKGIIEFIDLARGLPEYDFYWFGYTNPSLVSLEVKEALENKPKNLYLPGFVDEYELRDAYMGANLFVFLTHEETEGIVVLEALASKIPILIRDIPVFSPWLKDGLNVYKADSKENFIKKTSAILKKDLPDLTEEGYKVALDRDLKNIGKKLRLIYQSFEEKPTKEPSLFEKYLKIIKKPFKG